MDNITKYYINLDRSTERRDIMESKYTNLNRITAFDGNTLSTYNNITKPIKTRSNELELACSFSHLKAIITAYENELDEVIIFEDDIYCDYIDKWDKKIDEIIKKKPANTECLILHCINPLTTTQLLKVDCDYSDYNKYHIGCGAGCYYMTRKGMEIIKNKYYHDDKYCLNKWDRPTHAADHGIIHKLVKTYYYTRPLFNHQVKASTIHNENLPRHRNTLRIITDYFKITDTNTHHDKPEIKSRRNIRLGLRRRKNRNDDK